MRSGVAGIQFWGRVVKNAISNANGVLERIYDSALDDTFFDTVLDTLHRFFPGTAILLIGQDTRHPSGNFMLHRGLNTDAILPSFADMTIDNPWLEKFWQRKEGVLFQDDDPAAQTDGPSSKTAKKWLTVMGSLACATGMVINRRRTRQLVLEIRYPEGDRNRMRREISMLLEELGPHLVRAANIVHLNFHRATDAQLASDVLEMFPFPMLVMDAEYRIQCINERAEAMADKMDTFFISAEGEFHAVDMEAELELRRVVKRLSNGPRHDHELVPLPNADKSDRLFLSLTKLGKPAQRQLGNNSFYEKQSPRLALVIQDTKEPLKLSHRAMWSAFKLTNAEAELASMLLEGCSVGECAHRQDLAKQTLRNHLGSIMRKTETNRQPQLVALLTRLALSTLH